MVNAFGFRYGLLVYWLFHADTHRPNATETNQKTHILNTIENVLACLTKNIKWLVKERDTLGSGIPINFIINDHRLLLKCNQIFDWFSRPGGEGGGMLFINYKQICRLENAMKREF